MTKRMLIDAAHTEEVRVVVLDEDRIEDFEVETAGKEQIKGNIYVAEVTRVEPSLQAAFVNYGGNRNGFLAFSEIHPAYFDLPKDEKEALLNELNEIAARRRGRDQETEARLEENDKGDSKQDEKADNKTKEQSAEAKPEEETSTDASDKKATKKDDKEVKDETPESLSGLTPEEMEEDARALALASSIVIDDNPEAVEEAPKKKRGRPAKKPKRHSKKDEKTEETTKDAVKAEEGKDNKEGTSNKEDETNNEAEERRVPIHRRYSIGDVLKEGQKILIQVNKEERGNKGAAVSTYISLPGRYSVLMPNTPYAGGISRKITDFSVRREIKSTMSKLNIPENMGVIIRTAGVGQEFDSIEKDLNNMLSLWKKIETGFGGSKKAPYLIHEDGSLAVRSIRDMFNDEIDEVFVSNRKTYRAAKDYMKSLMPESAKKVKEYKLHTPIFTHYGVEDKLNRLHTTRVNLPSGGYLIINPTEALVSVDVNSGKATQEKNIEETALKTNLEAAEEMARQLRLRDLAGLIVIDFIDMEESRNEKAVEKMMRKCVRKDRARIQIAPISTFGLLEMSRQRLRPSLGESTMQPCSHCNGTGWVPSLASAALTLLRSLEDENIRTKAERVVITTSDELALYILNHKRELLKDIEGRYGFDIFIRGDDKYHAPDHRIDIIRKDNRGNEKRHTIEVILREPMEDDSYKKRGRNRNRKNEKNANKRDNKRDHNKGDNKQKSAQHDEKPSKEEGKKASQGNDNKKNDDNNEKTTDSDNKRRGGGRVRHLRRGSRKKSGDENASSDSVESNSSKQNVDKVANNADAAHKKASHSTAKPSKPKKGITVEHVSDSGEKSVSNTKSATVGQKFQRWWSKTTS